MADKNNTYVFIALGLLLAQLLIQGSIGFWGGRINLSLVALIILLNFSEFHWVVIFAVISGLLSDIYSGLPFGLMAFALFFSAAVLKILFDNFFTNFSYYSLLLLGIISVSLYNAIFIALIGLIYLIGLSDYLPKAGYSYKILWQIFSTGILMSLAYYLINSRSRKFKPVFLG